MYIKRNIKWSIIFKFAWKNLIIFIALSSAVVYFYHYIEHLNSNGDRMLNIAIPFEPLSVIGIAVSFYIGFKNNAAYDRFWEARKIWGGIVNSSRTFASQVMANISNSEAKGNMSEEDIYETKKELIYRHLAYINALRLQLRQPSSFSLKHPKTVKSMMKDKSDPTYDRWQFEVGNFLEAKEYEYLIERRNTATHIIKKQSDQLSALNESGFLNDFRHNHLMQLQEEFYTLQGKCERIKNTPFPRQYAYFSKIFTWIFVILLPFGMVGLFDKLNHELIWFTVPFCVLISWIFTTMEVVGDSSEDPFENFINDVPMTALCRTIEIDLKEMLGETNLPEKIKPSNDILL